MDLILAFDFGTSSLRTAFFTAEAQRLVQTTAREGYPLHTTPDGGATLSPALLREATLHALEATMRALRGDRELAKARIVGIGVSCFWHSFVGIAEGNTAITPVITWADSRCREDAAALRREFDERDTHARTGCMLRASFWPAKLVWLRRTRPSLFKKVRQWVSPAEWLQREFCGEAPCAYGMATGTGLFNPSKLAWVPALLERCEVTPEQLGALGETPTRLLPEWASRFPELAEAPWFPAIGDGAAGNLGCGATRPGLAAINVGTSAALRVMKAGSQTHVRARAPFGLFCYRVDAERFLVGGAVSNAGNLHAWCLRELKLPEDPAAIEQALRERARPEHGLTILPFWTAERAPTWNDAMQGAIVGLTQSTTALDLLQATTEAVYYRIARIAAMLTAEKHEETQAHTQSQTPPQTRPRFIVSGGILKSPASLARLANILDAPLYPSDEPEASLRGAAVFVAEKLGTAIAPLRQDKPVRPNRLNAALYRESRLQQERLEELLGEEG